MNLASAKTRVSLWFLGLITCAMLAGFPAVRRTQEARVLVGAREMLGGGWHAWMVPHVNGKLRLQKPPLAYWVSAIAFKFLGVNEWAGRLPAVLAGWGTIAITCTAARRTFGRSAVFAAVILAGCWLQVRFNMLAETDGLATFFVTAAIASFWRAIVAPPRSVFWFHLASLCIAGAIMSKGPPGCFPLLFLLAWPVVRRGDLALWRWIRCGAPLTFLALALPWWAYILHTVGYHTLVSELHDLTSGRDHGASPLVYLPMLLLAFAPWTPVVIAGLCCAIRRCREQRIRALLVWAAAVMAPLCFVGNKQPHYLLPVLPPMAILCGCMIGSTRPCTQGRGVRGEGLAKRSQDPLTLALSPGIPRERVARIFVFIGVCISAGLMSTIALISPRLEKSDSRTMASELLRQFPHRPFCFTGDGDYLPLCFVLRQQVPFYKEKNELMQAISMQPQIIILQQTPSGTKSNPLSPPLIRVTSIGAGSEHIDVYQVGKTTP